MISEEEKDNRQRAWMEYLDRQGMGPRHRKAKEHGPQPYDKNEGSDGV